MIRCSRANQHCWRASRRCSCPARRNRPPSTSTSGTTPRSRTNRWTWRQNASGGDLGPRRPAMHASLGVPAAWTCGPAGVGLSSGMATLGAPIGLEHRHRASGRARTVAGVTVSAVSLVLMVAQVPFFVSIALTTPLGMRVALSLYWLAVFTLGVHWRRRPVRVLVLAIAMVVTWYGIGVLAGPHLDWFSLH